MFNKNHLIDKVKTSMMELNNKQIEREEEISMLILTLFAKKNLLFVGEPGVSKTGLLDMFLGVLSDGNTFKCTIKDDTKYEELFGDRYFDESGKMIYDFSNSMIDAHIARLDEIWKGNSKILNSLLSATSNYRVVDIRGKGEVKIPNISTFAASNELPTDQALEALHDRFIVAMIVKPIKDNENWLKFISRRYDKSPILQNKFSLAEIEYIYKESFKVQIDISIYKTILSIKNKIKSINIACSDRRFDGAIEILQVSAFLNRRDYVDETELFLLVHMLWKLETDIEKVYKIIFEEIFGNLDEVKKVVIYNENRMNKLLGYKDGHLKDFLKFRNSFDHSLKELFENQLEQVKSFQNELDIVINGFQSVMSHYETVIDIEKNIAKNLFLPNYKNHIYGNIDIVAIKNHLSLLNLEYQNIKEWLDENSQLYVYNSKVSR